MEEVNKIIGYTYKLVCNDGYYYIGSTINELKGRLYDHKRCAKKNPTRKVYEHILQLGWENVKIEPIEKIICENRKELYQKEDIEIRKCYTDKFCLNDKSKVIQTKDERKQQQLEYIENNQEKIKQSRKIYNKENSKKRCDYSKKCALEHQEQVKEVRKEYNIKNKEKIAENCKEYAENHKEEIAEYKKKYHEENKEEIHKKSKEFREKNKEKIKEKSKEYYEENKEIILEKFKEYREKNKDKNKEYLKLYREKNKDILSQQFECECGGTYLQRHKKRHEESKKHLSYNK
jgi:hypothetical protein